MMCTTDASRPSSTSGNASGSRSGSGVGTSLTCIHDTGRTAWWLLIYLIPLIGAIVLLVFFCIDSTPGNNQYGPSPKGLAPA